MAQRTRFFDSVAGDRVYDSAAMSQLLAGISAPDGVFADYANGMLVTANTPDAMNVLVQTGACIAQGRSLEVYGSAEVLTVTAAHATLSRIDSVVARITFASRTMALAVKAGTAAATPAPPTLTQDATTWELVLANVFVNPAVTSITGAKVLDQRKLLTMGNQARTLPRSIVDERAILCWTDCVQGMHGTVGDGQQGALGLYNLNTSTRYLVSSDAVNGKLELTTGTVAIGVTGWRTEGACAKGLLNPRIMTSLIPQAGIATMVIQFWGFFSNPVLAAGTADSKAGFRATTTGNLFCVTGNGTTEQLTDLGVAALVQTRYEVRSDNAGASWKFYINDALVATHATTIPSASTVMYPTIALLNSAIVDLRISRVDYFLADQDREILA